MYHSLRFVPLEKYSIGDKVKIKDTNWFLSHTNIDHDASLFYGTEMTIIKAEGDKYLMREDYGEHVWDGECIDYKII